MARANNATVYLTVVVIKFLDSIPDIHLLVVEKVHVCLYMLYIQACICE